MKINNIIGYFITLLMMICVACNPEDDRLLSYQHTVQVGLYSAHTHNDTTLVNVKVWGENRPTTDNVRVDSLLYDEPQVGSLFLNLNMNADSTVFYIKNRTLVDRVSFYYSKSLESVSGAGGITMEMKLDTMFHTMQSINSAKMVHKPIRYNEDRENVQLFIY
ncbi:MAG: DUF6452 family protein [Bacteroidia bacterium]|nr:DUF6452 family protein [Bacteroidia bacterium]